MKKILMTLILTLGLAGAVALPCSAMSDNPGIEAVEPQQEIKLTENGITITNNGSEDVEVYVFAITGMQIKHLTLSPASTADVNLAPGYYIVRIGKLSRRIAVK